ncbi:MAG: DUF2062 domain-containing protein [Candidatus Omnitrophota bacterium]
MLEKFKDIKKSLRDLLVLHSSPHGIALGVALGVFIGILPLYGLHTLLVIVAAVLVKDANKVAIFLGTSISLPPTVPFITWAGYNIGTHMLSGTYPPFPWDFFSHFSYRELWRLYLPLFTGSCVIAVIGAVMFYFLVVWAARRWAMRRQAKNQ